MVVPTVGIILPQVRRSRTIKSENRSDEHQAAATALKTASSPTIWGTLFLFLEFAQAFFFSILLLHFLLRLQQKITHV